MLVELSFLLAVNSCEPVGSTADSFTICAERVERSSSQSSIKAGTTVPKATPMRLCSYFLNSSIDVPTFGVITAWIPVGARSCIGDIPPEPPVASKSSSSQSVNSIKESLTGFSNRPVAYWDPGGQLEVTESGQFNVTVNNRTTTGQLLGQTAQIRFSATSTSWQFSDSVTLSGSSVSRVFEEVGLFLATAKVNYQVDYRFAGQAWVIGATVITLSSNELEIEVIEPPRRTLLIL